VGQWPRDRVAAVLAPCKMASQDGGEEDTNKTKKQGASDDDDYHEEDEDFKIRRRTSRPRNTPVPKFLLKTYEILEKPDYQDMIHWSPDGTAIIIDKVHDFSQNVLPLYFKHSNYMSFIRQLNMYGFTRSEVFKDKLAFSQPLFQRGRKENLVKMQRKTQIPKTPSSSSEKDSLTKTQKELAAVMKQLKEQQEKQLEFDAKMNKLKAMNNHLGEENRMLWEAMADVKSRSKALTDRMRKLFFWLYKNMLGPQARARSGEDLANEMMPRILDSAKDVGIEIKELEDGHLEGDDKEKGAQDLLQKSKHAMEEQSKGAVGLDKMPTLGTFESFSPQYTKDETPSKHAPDLQPLPSLSFLESDSKSVGYKGSQSSALPLERADSLTRGPSLQSYFDLVESSKTDPKKSKETGFDRHEEFASGLKQYLDDQDNTFSRMESISNAIDPFHFILDDDDRTSGSGAANGDRDDEKQASTSSSSASTSKRDNKRQYETEDQDEEQQEEETNANNSRGAQRFPKRAKLESSS